MKIVVTGGSGQLGTVVLRRLLADRTIKEIVSIDRRPPALLVGRRLRHVDADVRDPEIGRHLEGAAAVIHLAFVVTEPAGADFESINVAGSKHVFAAALTAGVKQILYSSSIAAYGVAPGHPEPITEDTPRRRLPEFPYGRTKFDVEAHLDELERAHPDVAFVRIRPVILVGTHMEHALGRSFQRRVMPGGREPLTIVWDEDVAEAFYLALTKKARGAFIMTAEPSLPPPELARAVGMRVVAMPELLRRHAAEWLARRAAVDPSWLRLGDVRLIPTSARARRELGWTPRCPTGVDVMRRYLETAPRRLDARLATFFFMADALARFRRLPELAGVDARITLRMTGPRGGELGILASRSQVRIRRTPARPPTSIVTVAASDLVGVLGGRLDWSTVEMTGRLRVEGDPFAGILLGSMFTMVRTQSQARGPAGVLARAFCRWAAADGAPA